MNEVAHPTGLWTLRAISLIALLVAGYLLATSVIAGDLPAGCGAGSGCAEVLTSRWAYVGQVSVTLPAVLVYVAFLGASWLTGASNPVVSTSGWLALLTLSSAVVLAAAWFIGLQAFVLKTWCFWCLAEHALGIALAVTTVALFLRYRGLPGRPGRVSQAALAACFMAGMFGTGLLAAGQVVFPVRQAPLVRLPADRNSDTGPGSNRQLSVLNGSLPLVAADEPMLGDPQSPYVLVVLFDYCCPHCRETHGHLLEGLETYHGAYSLLLLPVPLDKSCNPHVDETEPRFESACELARLALAVWKADRTKFREFDAWLFAAEMPRDPAEARARAESLVTRDRLTTALADPWIGATLQRNIEAYERSTAGRIPVVLSPGFPAIVGRPADATQLIEILERELRLTKK